MFVVPSDPQSLSQLIEQLKSGLPRSSTVKVCAQNARSAKVEAKFYTDGWPDFTTVVCQIFYPKISEVADVIYYSTSKEKLLQVMKEGNLITWGRPQRIYCVEDAHTDYLIENLKPPTALEELEERDRGLVAVADYMLLYLLGELKQQNVVCPEGFILGKLEPHHAQFVSEHWSWYAGKPWAAKFLEALITNYDSSAVFASENPKVPVSWAMLWPWGHIAHSYTLKTYRQKGLATVVQSDLCEKVLANGDLLGTFTEPSNEPNVRLSIKLGFTEVCRCKPLVHIASRLDF